MQLLEILCLVNLAMLAALCIAIIRLSSTIKKIRAAFNRPMISSQAAETRASPEDARAHAPSAAPARDGRQEELVAVLAAAVAASLGVSEDALIVRSYRRVCVKPEWNRAGRTDAMQRYF